MEYRALVAAFEELQATAARTEKTALLADLLSEVNPSLLGPVIRLTRGTVSEPWESGDLGVSSALTLDAVVKATAVPEEEVERWWRELGDLGSAAERAARSDRQATLLTRELTVESVHDRLRGLADLAGAGSRDRRVAELAGLISDAEPVEVKYLVRTAGGAMRLGVGAGLLRDAIARAFLPEGSADVDVVKRSLELTNDFGEVAVVAQADGVAGLAELDVELFRPIKPMLAQQADDLETAIAELGDESGAVLVEHKYDGMRAQIHGRGAHRRLYTRRLEDVTKQFPDVVRAVASGIDAERFIIEAELVGRYPDSGEVVPFQKLSRRIKRKHDIDRLAGEIPVTTHAFDVLSLNGDSLLDHPLHERLEALAGLLEVTETLSRADHLVVDAAEDARAFRAASLEAGHEGVMVKNLAAIYEPGSRVGYQQKVKETLDPLDLVVTRAKWSEGRKRGFLGRPYLACRDADGNLREVGRMHTGFTDDQLAEFTSLVEPLIERVDGREATLTPSVVLEVECAEIQESSTYDAGYALRFPRLRRIRRDLELTDIDTLERIAALHERSA